MVTAETINELINTIAIFIPVVGLLGAYLITRNIVWLKWSLEIEDLEQHYKILLQNKSLSNEDIRSIINKIIICKMNIEGKNAFMGTRPFLVGVWKWIITPLFITLCILIFVAMLTSPKLVVYVILVQLILITIVTLYRVGFHRMNMIISSKSNIL